MIFDFINDSDLHISSRTSKSIQIKLRQNFVKFSKKMKIYIYIYTNFQDLTIIMQLLNSASQKIAIT